MNDKASWWIDANEKIVLLLERVAYTCLAPCLRVGVVTTYFGATSHPCAYPSLCLSINPQLVHDFALQRAEVHSDQRFPPKL